MTAIQLMKKWELRRDRIAAKMEMSPQHLNNKLKGKNKWKDFELVNFKSAVKSLAKEVSVGLAKDIKEVK